MSNNGNESDKMRIEYVALAVLSRWDRNPKDHDIGLLSESIKRHGYVSPIIIDENSQTLVAGHGRLDTILTMKENGFEPPNRVMVDKEGEWQIPVVRGIWFRDELEKSAYALADNRITEVGGWHEGDLLEVLVDLAGNDSLAGVGWDADDVDFLIQRHEEEQSEAESESENGTGGNSDWPTIKLQVTPEAYVLFEENMAKALAKNSNPGRAFELVMQCVDKRKMK